MTYTTGSTIVIGDYNGFIGTPTGSIGGQDVSTLAFANSTEATQKVGALIGIGYEDRGYGQSSFTLPRLVIGDVIRSSHWTNLRNAIETSADHQGTAKTNLVPTTDLEIGDTIVAHDGVPATNNELNSLIPTIDTNRLNNDSGASMTLSAATHTSARATSWSATIDTIVTATWSTADAARYFFNSGGEIRITVSHANVSSPQNSDWNSILLNKVGTINFKAQTSTQTASTPAGVVGAVGYYDLAVTNTRVYDGLNIGGGAYTANDVFIDALYTGSTANGAKGNVVQFTITLQDQHTGTSDTVASGTTATFDVLRATVHLTGIATPSWATTDSF